MCGLAGYTNVPVEARRALALALGAGVDTRGGHSSGYVSASPRGHGGVRYARRVGEWAEGSEAWQASALQGDLTIIHSRYATCGERDDVLQAHPFAIRRPLAEGARTVLWGAHNGMLEGTRASALQHGRRHTVDSRELFELLADGLVREVGELQGYGTLAWVANTGTYATRDRIHLVAMTSDAALAVASTADGACVFASTKDILEGALDAAGLTLATYYEVTPGRVLEAHLDGRVTYSDHPDVTLRPRVARQWAPAPSRVYDSDRWSRALATHATHATLDTAGYLPGWDVDAPSDDDDTAQQCPYCYSLDTWEWQGVRECADCNSEWTLDVDGSPTLADTAPSYDSSAFGRWVEEERNKFRAGGGSTCS